MFSASCSDSAMPRSLDSYLVTVMARVTFGSVREGRAPEHWRKTLPADPLRPRRYPIARPSRVCPS